MTNGQRAFYNKHNLKFSRPLGILKGPPPEKGSIEDQAIAYTIELNIAEREVLKNTLGSIPIAVDANIGLVVDVGIVGRN